MIPQDEAVTAVARLGFTPRQARFLVLVLRHAGVCLARQYCAFAGIAYGQQMHDFFKALVARKYAIAYPCPDRRGRLYHLHSRRLYRAIGAPDHPHRRAGSLGRAVERLMLLDALLLSPELGWLATPEEKRAQLATFAARTNVDNGPAGDASAIESTLHSWMLDKLPIGVGPHDEPVVFVYLVTSPSPSAFRAFLHRHISLFSTVPRWRICLVIPPSLEASATTHRAVFDAVYGGASIERIARETSALGCHVLRQRYHGLAHLVGTA